MSIRFTRTSSQSAISLGTVSLSYPIVISVEFRMQDLTVDQALVALTDADGDDYHAGIFLGGTLGNPIAARTRASGTNADAVSTSGIGSITPARGLFVFESDSSRTVYLDGTNSATNTDTRSPVGLDRLQIGGRNLDLFASADVAEVAIWSGTALTAAQIGQLNLGISPLLVAPEALAFFSPLQAITPNPFKDEVAHIEMNLSGGPTLSDMGISSVGFNQPVYPPPPVNVINAMVENILDLNQLNSTNLPNGYGVSDLDFSQEALNNIIQESVSNDMGFSMEALNNIIEESVTEAIGFSLEALNNIRQESATNTVFITALEAGNNILTGSASSEIDFQQLVETNIFFISAESTIDFDVFGGIVKEESASNTFDLDQAGWSQFYFFAAENTIDFDIDVAIDGTERMLNVDNTIWLTPSAGKTLEDTAENTIDLEPEAARGDNASNTLDLDPVVVGVSSDPAETTLDLSQTVDREIEYNLSADSDLDFQQGVNGQICPQTSCDFASYNPTGPNLPSITIGSQTTVTLVCGADSLTLKNPEFGNDDSLLPGRAFNRSRHGRPCAFRNSTWPRSTVKTFTVSDICDADATGIVDFKRNCQGKEVTYTDMESRVWIGFLLDNNPLIDNGPNRKSVSFEFRGVLAAEKTWVSNP